MTFNNNKRIIFWTFLFFYFSTGLWAESVTTIEASEPFFSYTTDELQGIGSIPTPNTILTKESFEKWDSAIYEVMTESKIDGEATRLTAYLYVAQRDFALLSFQIHQKWLGTPDALIVKIIQLFYPKFNPSIPIQEDLYSSKLGQLVFSKIKDRFQREQKRLKTYSEKEGPDYWIETLPIFGQRIGSCYPWLITSVADLQASPPPNINNIIWQYGLYQIKHSQARLTPDQRKIIYYWAGQFGPESGNWFAIANHDLHEKNLSLINFLFIRAALAMGYMDSMIAVFDSKYTYWVKRPRMLDPTIVELVRCPKHPSYPSAHSTTSSTAAVILSYFFPEETSKWQNLAFEAGNSRIWGGLHYTYDNEQGLIQGEKVAKAVIKRLAPLIPTALDTVGAQASEDASLEGFKN